MSVNHYLSLISTKEKKTRLINDYLQKEYGSRFCELIGYDNLAKIRTVASEELGLKVTKYHETEVTSDKMKGHHFLYGKDQWRRPFLAVRCVYLNKEMKPITEVVELIFERYTHLSLSNLVTSLSVRGSNGRKYESVFYQQGKFEHDLFKNFMKGERIPHIRYTYYAKNSSFPEYPAYVILTQEVFSKTSFWQSSTWKWPTTV